MSDNEHIVVALETLFGEMLTDMRRANNINGDPTWSDEEIADYRRRATSLLNQISNNN